MEDDKKRVDWERAQCGMMTHPSINISEADEYQVGDMVDVMVYSNTL